VCSGVQYISTGLHHTRVFIRNYSHQGNIHQGHIVHYKLDYKASNTQQSYPVELLVVRVCISCFSPPFTQMIISITVFDLFDELPYNPRFFMKCKQYFGSRRGGTNFYIMFPRMYNNLSTIRKLDTDLFSKNTQNCGIIEQELCRNFLFPSIKFCCEISYCFGKIIEGF
jgi:hypothetical protein